MPEPRIIIVDDHQLAREGLKAVRLGDGIDGLEATRRIAALGLLTRIITLKLHAVADATGLASKEETE